MNRPAIVVTSARLLPGSVMGSPQSTTILRLQVQAVPVEMVRQTRSSLSAHLNRWFVGTEDCLDAAPAGCARCQAVVLLFAELFCAIQREAGVAIAQPIKEACQMTGQDEATLYLPTQSLKACEIAISGVSLLLNQLLSHNPQCDVVKAVEDLRERLKPFAEKGVNNFFILQAAFELCIPVFRPLYDVLVLGTGSRSRWLQSLISDETPMLGAAFAQAKHVTSTLLRTAGLPGGIHRLVKTREQAMQAANAIGYPVVVKPADADRGVGVAAGLKDANSVALAFDAAVKVSRNVLVERFARGHTHRLTVQEGQVIRVVRRIAGGVVGDGVCSIEELVALFQQTPQQQRFARRLGHQPLSLDEEALALLGEVGMGAQSRPAAGQYIRLRRRDNVNAGATNEELVPDDPSMVHPDNLRLAIEAARVLRLDFAGIDLITTDIARSWLEVGALICEVNARPQMGGNNDPLLYQRLLKRLLPNGATIAARLLVVPENVAEQARIKDTLLEQDGGAISMSAGLWIDGKCSTQPFRHSFAAAQALLQRLEVSRALCFMTVKDIYKHGLPLSNWDDVTVAVTTAFRPDELKLLDHIKPWLEAAERAA